MVFIYYVFNKFTVSNKNILTFSMPNDNEIIIIDSFQKWLSIDCYKMFPSHFLVIYTSLCFSL